MASSKASNFLSNDPAAGRAASHAGASSSANGARSIDKTDGSLIAVIRSYRIVNLDAPSPADRTVKFISDDADATNYHTKNITELGKDIVGIKLLRGSELHNAEDDSNSLAAQIAFPEPNDRKIIANLGCSAGALMIVDPGAAAEEHSADHKAKHLELRGLPDGQSLLWRSSNDYVRASREKSRAGDFELIGTDVRDGTERILAIFLNRWAGNRGAEDLGTLHLTEDGSEKAISEIAIASITILGDYFSKRKRDYLLHGLETGAFVCCVQ